MSPIERCKTYTIKFNNAQRLKTVHNTFYQLNVNFDWHAAAPELQTKILS